MNEAIKIVSSDGFWKFASTVVWVCTVWWLLKAYRDPISRFLEALQSRIERGSSVKLPGGVELGELKAATVEQQVEKTKAEVVELLQASKPSNEFGSRQHGNPAIAGASGRATGVVADEGFRAPPTSVLHDLRRRMDEATDESDRRALERRFREVLAERSIEAENLALRAVQAKVNVPISRNVALKKNFIVDGAFVLDGVLTVIEVRYIADPINAETYINRGVSSLSGKFQTEKISNADALFVAVVEFERDLMAVLAAIPRDLTSPFAKLKAEAYSLEALRKRFEIYS